MVETLGHARGAARRDLLPRRRIARDAQPRDDGDGALPLCIEFHGSRSGMPNALPNPPSLLTKLRDPQRWKRKLRPPLPPLPRRGVIRTDADAIDVAVIPFEQHGPFARRPRAVVVISLAFISPWMSIAWRRRSLDRGAARLSPPYAAERKASSDRLSSALTGRMRRGIAWCP
jgi:hypothetical protein